ncbi:MAG TPA: hypothetical protein VGM51_11595 [Armatimonadota bacterium]|jgi:exopolyphosphatase/guanosine-5'-triphosphate,3'-diphosphate pyrophosphatase
MDAVHDTPDPVAAIDIGTNSVKCLVARVRDGAVEEPLLDTSVTTRLGEGLGGTGRLNAIAIERTAQCVAELVASAHRLYAQRIRITGTSAVREAANPEGLTRRIHELCGLGVDILPGEEEARLAYLGAVGASARRVAIIDVGGGSTEWAVGEGSRIAWRHSYPAGAVRFTEKYFRSDPPTPAEVDDAARAAGDMFQSAPCAESVPVVAVGGTARTVALVALGGEGTAEGFEVAIPELRRQIALYASMDLIHRREIPGIEAHRAEIVIAGAIVLAAAITQAGVPGARCTLRGLRHGIVLELASRPF